MAEVSEVLEVTFPVTILLNFYVLDKETKQKVQDLLSFISIEKSMVSQVLSTPHIRIQRTVGMQAIVMVHVHRFPSQWVIMCAKQQNHSCHQCSSSN